MVTQDPCALGSKSHIHLLCLTHSWRCCHRCKRKDQVQRDGCLRRNSCDRLWDSRTYIVVALLVLSLIIFPAEHMVLLCPPSFLLFGSSAARSDWQILRKPHHLAMMFTSSFIFLLCFPLHLLAFWGRKWGLASFYISVWEDFGKLGVFVWNSPIARRTSTYSEEITAGSFSLNYFFSQKDNGQDITEGIRIFPPMCVSDKYSLRTKSLTLWYVH